jgi:hypothetical protein
MTTYGVCVVLCRIKPFQCRYGGETGMAGKNIHNQPIRISCVCRE